MHYLSLLWFLFFWSFSRWKIRREPRLWNIWFSKETDSPFASCKIQSLITPSRWITILLLFWLTSLLKITSGQALLQSECQFLWCKWKRIFYLLLMSLCGSFCFPRFIIPWGKSVYNKCNFYSHHTSQGTEPWGYAMSLPWFMTILMPMVSIYCTDFNYKNKETPAAEVEWKSKLFLQWR